MKVARIPPSPAFPEKTAKVVLVLTPEEAEALAQALAHAEWSAADILGELKPVNMACTDEALQQITDRIHLQQIHGFALQLLTALTK